MTILKLGDRDANELPSSQPIKMSVTNRNLSKSIMIRFQTHTFNFDDQPISIKSCLVDIAHDYTKKKNVFRLKTFNGSEYLFQADENNTMLDWIRSIQSNNNPDADVSPTFLWKVEHFFVYFYFWSEFFVCNSSVVVMFVCCY